MTLEELYDKANEIQDIIEKEVEVYYPKIQERISKLQVLSAVSGKCLAEAKYLQDKRVYEEANKLIDGHFDKFSASTINLIIKSAGKEYNRIVTWFDRINSTITHQLDSLRSQLSFIKSEMNNK